MNGPHRVGGHLALDFANTISDRGTANERDHLADADAIRRWAEAAGLLASVGQAEGADDAGLLAEADRLRAAILAIGAALVSGGAAPADALAALHAVASRTLAQARIAARPDGTVGFDFPAGSAAILGSVAWAAVDLVRFGPLDRLKQCPPQSCGWLFLDTTKNRSRRWCSMETCGNREKARRHRHG